MGKEIAFADGGECVGGVVDVGRRRRPIFGEGVLRRTRGGDVFDGFDLERLRGEVWIIRVQ